MVTIDLFNPGKTWWLYINKYDSDSCYFREFHLNSFNVYDLSYQNGLSVNEIEINNLLYKYLLWRTE